MDGNNKTVFVIVAGVIALVMFFTFVPSGRKMWNRYEGSLEKADEVSYETRKQVEDTARAMIASYKTAVNTYEQYRNSDSEQKQGWAEQALMTANRTANSYNEYILKNSFVWKDNIPQDIRSELPIITPN